MATTTQLTLIRNADPDAEQIGALYRLGRQSMLDSIHHLIETGQRLAEKKDSLGHGNWIPWLADNAEVLGFGHATATRLMKVGKLKYCVDATFDQAEVLQLNRLIWGNNVRGTQGTGENEWFTPVEYIELARGVLGEIDLDPATHEQAQAIVRAARYFTKPENGLEREWHGRVWLNPPYAQPLIADFVSKMCAERKAGRITAAIMLTHNYTDTTWFHEAAGVADAICFTRGRVKFYEPDGTIAAPTQGQAFFYLGNDLDLFASKFAAIGLVVLPAKSSADDGLDIPASLRRGPA